MTSWTDEYRQMLDDCEARESRLTDWERGFIDSIHDQLGADRGVTARQIEILDRIWERVTARG